MSANDIAMEQIQPPRRSSSEPPPAAPMPTQLTNSPPLNHGASNGHHRAATAPSTSTPLPPLVTATPPLRPMNGGAFNAVNDVVTTAAAAFRPRHASLVFEAPMSPTVLDALARATPPWADSDNEDAAVHVRVGCSDITPSLRFTDDQLNDEYDRDYLTKYRNSIAFTIAACIVIWVLFVIVDIIKYVEGSRDWFEMTLAVRFGVAAVAVAVVVLMVYNRWVKERLTSRSLRITVAALILIFGTAQICFGLIELSPLDPTYSTMIVLISSMTASSFRLPFFLATCCNAILWIIFILITGICQLNDHCFPKNDDADLLPESVWLLLGVLLFSYHAYNVEMSMRSTYLAERKLKYEEDKGIQQLARMLPIDVIRKVKRNLIVNETHDNVSVLFSHIHQFDELTARLHNPALVIRLLNTIFSEFDRLTDVFGVYKVETIGEVYLVSCGVPVQDPPIKHHASLLALVAIAMCDMMTSPLIQSQSANQTISLRIGIHSGPVTAGVIGMKYPRYRLMGDTVNTASRMSTTCAGGQVQISHKCFRSLSPNFICEYNGTKEIKGKGPMQTFHLKYFTCRQERKSYVISLSNSRAQADLDQSLHDDLMDGSPSSRDQSRSNALVVGRLYRNGSTDPNTESYLDRGECKHDDSHPIENIVRMSHHFVSPLTMIFSERQASAGSSPVFRSPQSQPSTPANRNPPSFMRTVSMSVLYPVSFIRNSVRRQSNRDGLRESLLSPQVEVEEKKIEDRIVHGDDDFVEPLRPPSPVSPAQANELSPENLMSISAESFMFDTVYSRVTDLLNRNNAFSLRFSDFTDLESLFQLQWRKNFVGVSQRGIFIFTAFISVLIIIDVIDHDPEIGFWCQLAAAIFGGLVLSLSYLFKRVFSRHQQLIVSFTWATMAILQSQSFILLRKADYIKFRGVMISLLSLTCTSFFIGLQVPYVIITTTLILITYVAVGWPINYAVESKPPLVALYVLASSVLAIIAAHTNEKYHRIDFLRYTKMQEEQRQTKHLASAMLPKEVMEAVQSAALTNSTIFNQRENASVLFCDVVGFTKLAVNMNASDVVGTLSFMFSIFDALTTKHSIYKVETIGNAYLACSGVVSHRLSHHTLRLVRCAIDFQIATHYIRTPKSQSIAIRVGIHSGPLIAGVVGQKMQRYHLFGQTVTIAEEIEQAGKDEEVHVSSTTQAIVRDQFEWRKLPSLDTTHGMIERYAVGRFCGNYNLYPFAGIGENNAR